jgi:hypothetical protein
MKHSVFFALVLTLFVSAFMSCETTTDGDKVLIIQDELPQMEILANFLTTQGNLDVTVVDQETLPGSLVQYESVIMYIHGELHEPTEMAVIEYTENGGRLIALHHSISSGKAKNRYYFDFLGIQLDNPGQSSQPVEPGGGYGWTHNAADGSPVTLTLVNLNPGHYIVANDISWGDSISYIPSDFPSTEESYATIDLPESEIYFNHKFTDGREKTVLMGYKYFDDRNEQLFMQDRAGWTKPSGDGEIIYLMPGHSSQEFENPQYRQMILNAVQWLR